MKATVAPYATSVSCGRVVCRSGLTIRIAAYPFDLTMSNATVYQSGSGFEYSGYTAEASFAASVVDLEGFVGYAGITRDKLASGLFDGAECYYFTTNFLAPVEDQQPDMKAVFGKTTLDDERYKIEQMALVDLLGQDFGLTYTAGCPKKFGGQEYGGCGVDLGPITVTGTITHVPSAFQVRDSARAEAADYFGWGYLTFTSGDNAGLDAIRVDSHASDGTLTLMQAPYYAVTVGTTYSLVPGCRGRLEDCRDKHGNIPRFGGDPWIPQSSQYKMIGGQT